MVVLLVHLEALVESQHLSVLLVQVRFESLDAVLCSAVSLLGLKGDMGVTRGGMG